MGYTQENKESLKSMENYSTHAQNYSTHDPIIFLPLI